MSEKQRLAFLIIVSFAFHIMLLYLIPVLDFTPKEKDKIYEVKLIKPKPKKKIKKHYVKKHKNVKKSKNVTAKKPSKKNLKKKKIDYKGFKKPDVKLPTIDNDEKIKKPAGNIDVKDLTPEQFTKQAQVNVKSEIQKESYSSNTGNIKKNSKNSSYKSSENFLQINSLSNERRGLVSYPPKPEFSLENNTKVRIKFKIDRHGIPTNIRFVTRSVSSIEKISLDYVKKLRFSAVEYEKPDEVEITLYFKVK